MRCSQGSFLQFLRCLNIDQNAPEKNLEQIYGPSHCKTTSGPGPWEVPKLETHTFMHFLDGKLPELQNQYGK